MPSFRRSLLLASALAFVLATSAPELASASAATSRSGAARAGADTPAIDATRRSRKPALQGTSTTKAHWACPAGACEVIVGPQPVKVPGGYALPGSPHILAGSGERRGLDPQDLQSAYEIPTTVSSPQTIALIDAFGYPDAESDLATYRERYGLPPCTKANGCFKKVDQEGKEGDYPPAEEGWDTEAALDEDMASAACPQCHILLVEGKGELPADLGAAVNTAAELGATEISNSYAYPELDKELCGKTECAQYNKDYEHPGVLITAAAGDSGYDDTYFELGFGTTNFPASSPHVVAVGGTALFKEASLPRGWFEEVWNEPALAIGTGSGCTTEAKPAWQTDSGCAKRTDDDVAAVAAVVTPVSIRIDGSWSLVGGTSVASPLVAGIEAHASAAVRSLGARAFYAEPGSLFDVTEGFDWNPFDPSGASECAPQEYLCNAETGYDGPTGLGTPDGVPLLSEPPTVTQLQPNDGPIAGATAVTITGTNFTSVKEVDFGSLPAKGFTVVSPTSISAESPAVSATKTVAVRVTTAAGKSALSRGDSFTYKKT
jgi:IPT/TIG domain/Subtilase family